MPKAYPHQISIPRILIDSNATRTTGGTGVLPAVSTLKIAGADSHVTVDKSAPSPLQDPSIGSSVIFSVGGVHRARSQGEGE